MGQRLAVWVWYRGDAFGGFQVQPGERTVQAELFAALAPFDPRPVAMPSGRTDRGVHARMQVVTTRRPKGLEDVAGFGARLGAALPQGLIGVAAVRAPPPGFHSMWSASGKEYRYRFALGAGAPKGWESLCWPVRARPEALERALARAVGRRDFAAFHDRSGVRKERTLQSATLHELGEGLFEARFVADSFAKHQVRYLAGAAAQVAQGELGWEEYEAALEAGRPCRARRAPGTALVLWEVHYPEELDPFTGPERAQAAGVPGAPPFYWES